jgi:hypothetical protein
MSALATTGGAMVTTRFAPSIAQEIGGRESPELSPSGDRSRAAIWAFNIALSMSASYVPSYAAMARPTDFVVAARTAEPSGAVQEQASASTQAMVATLKARGMPIAALSDVLDVERKTIYAWLDDGVEAKHGNYERLQAVHSVLVGEPDGSLRYFHRLWERKSQRGVSLKAALTALQIDPTAVHEALEDLRPAVNRAMQSAASKRASSADMPAGSLLTTHLIAGA